MSSSSEALAAFRASGLLDADPALLFGLASPGAAGGSDSGDSDYRNLLADEDDEAELLSMDGGGDTSMESSHIFRGPQERQGLLPGVEEELARRHTEHAISMASIQYERQLDELTAKLTAIARQREKALRQAQRHEVRRRDKAIKALVAERDAFAARAAAAEAELEEAAEEKRLAAEVSELQGQLAASRRSVAKHQKQVAATERQVAATEKQVAAVEKRLTEAKAHAAAERSTFEVRLAAQQERLEDVSTRCLRAEQAEAELRREIEAHALKEHDLERSLGEVRDKLDARTRELSAAVAEASLEKERVALLHREVEKLDESAKRAHAPTAQLQAEVRELSAALAAAREQRNQASREAENSRVHAAEASDDLQRSAEMVAATETRVAHAEKRAMQEAVGRQRAETHIQDLVVAQQQARSRRQKRMLAVLIRASRMQAMFGFTRWLAAIAAWDAEDARGVARRANQQAEVREETRRALVTALELRNAHGDRAASLGAAWLSCSHWWIASRGASAALARWAAATHAEMRCVRRWERLLKAMELAPRLLTLPPLPAGPQAVHTAAGHAHPSGGVRRLPPTSRMVLRVRTERLRAFHKRGFYRCKETYFDTGRIRRAIFVLWRQWVRGELLAEAEVVAEARKDGLHVASGRQHWWEVQAAEQ